MRYLDAAISKTIIKKIKRCSNVLLLLDYDGTLTPIVSKPQDAQIKSSTQSILKTLTKNLRFSVGIITGRSIEQMKRFLSLDNVLIAGTHGLELWGPNVKDRYNHALKFKKKMRKLKTNLKPLERKFAGSCVEDKKISIAYHYRLTNPALHSKIDMEFFKLTFPWIKKGEIKILEIKKGWEILPPIPWNKGKAVQWLLSHRHKNTFPLFIGDDVTDETAFKAVNSKGISIRVGRKKDSAAKYFVKSTREVAGLLGALAKIDQGQSKWKK